MKPELEVLESRLLPSIPVPHHLPIPHHLPNQPLHVLQHPQLLRDANTGPIINFVECATPSTNSYKPIVVTKFNCYVGSPCKLLVCPHWKPQIESKGEQLTDPGGDIDFSELYILLE